MSRSLVSNLKRRWFAVAAVLGVVGGAATGYLIGEGRGSAERAKTLADLDTYVNVLTRARESRESRPKLEGRLQGIADRTLGASLEAVDSEVRRRLNRACEELGLTEFSVTTGVSSARGTPAKKEFKRPDERKLRDEPDFVEVQATVAASGRPDQAFRLLARVDAEPWTKRVESIRLDPSGDGVGVRATIKLSTVFLPGLAAKSSLVLDPAALARANRYAELFASNPFRVPPPPVAATQVAAAQPAGTGAAAVGAPTDATSAAVPMPASPFPYGEWLLTGIVEGPGGPEVWLRHVPTGTALTLTPGTPIGELILRAVEYDFALFEGPGGSCRVQVGNNLTQRSASAR
jgi:hypothetical protein